MALIGAIDESAYLHHEEWLDTATSIAGVTGSTLVLADMDAEGTNARIVRVVVIMLFVRIARAIANIKMLRDILMPIAAVGANIPWVWSIVQYRGVELALDAARFNGEGSLLTVTRGACEVLAFGDGQRAYYLWLMVRSALIAIAAWAFERRYNNSAEG